MRRLSFGGLGEGRENNFDFLRFVLSTLVILSHSFGIHDGSNDREFLMRATGGQMTAGEVAIDGFFILSGFLITRSWLRSSGAAAYFRNRILRIYPGFLVAVAFCLLVACPLGSLPPSEYWRQQFRPMWLLLTTLNLSPEGLTTAGPDPRAINGSLWSIRYEFLCYIVVAALGTLGVLKRPRWVVVGFLAALGLFAGQVYFDLEMPFAGRASYVICYTPFWPRLMACFLAGAAFFLHRERIPCSARIAFAMMAVLVALALFPRLLAFPLAFIVAGAYLLFFAARLPIPWLHGFARRGDFSYGIYLYAFPVQVLVISRYAPRLNPWAASLVVLPVVLAVAVASWHLVEKPFLRRKEKHFPVADRPQGEPAAVG